MGESIKPVAPVGGAFVGRPGFDYTARVAPAGSTVRRLVRLGGAVGIVLPLLPAPAAARAPAAKGAAGADRDTPPAALRIERIEVVGRETVALERIDAILEQAGLSAGTVLEVPGDRRVRIARARLAETGYFRRVTLRLRPAGEPGSVVLVVELEERLSVSVTRVHAASSKLTPFHGGLTVVERNFLGKGVWLGGGFVWGTLPRIPRARRQQAYRLFAEVPRLPNAPLGVLGSVFLVSASEPYRVAGPLDDPDPDLFSAFDYDRIGASLGLSFPVVVGLDIGVEYRFERVDATLPNDPKRLSPDGGEVPVDLHMLDGARRHTVLQVSLTWDGRSQAYRLGKGGRIAMDLHLGSPGLGSEYEYLRFVAGGGYTFRLPWGHWVTPSVTAGQLVGRAPRFELFYAGDLSDWTPGREEGLLYSTRNPIDVFGTRIDERTFGNLFGVLDVEYVWPVFRRRRIRWIYGGDLFLSLGTFTIAGDRAQRAADRAAGRPVAPFGLRANFGLRLDTPLGVVDLSVGNILRRTPL